MINVNDSAVRFTGRWNIKNNKATTTAPGGQIECAFFGKEAVLHFDTTTNQHPYPHLWVRVDGGIKTEVPLDRYLRIECKEKGNHVIEIIFKSAVEMQHRWYEPLIGKITFCGIEAEEAGVLPVDNRKSIEFIGDSITEGVLIDAQYDYKGLDQPNRVYQDDVTATYAWLTAERLGLKPIIMGYGAVGMTTSGQGAVPKVNEAYPYCYDGAEYGDARADIIVINHGANDVRSEETEYIREYNEFLQLVRKRNSKAKIVVLSAFYGVHEKALGNLVQSYNEKYNDTILFVGTDGWIPQEPFHPLRDGHRIVADKLCDAINDLLKEI